MNWLGIYFVNLGTLRQPWSFEIKISISLPHSLWKDESMAINAKINRKFGIKLGFFMIYILFHKSAIWAEISTSWFIRLSCLHLFYVNAVNDNRTTYQFSGSLKAFFSNKALIVYQSEYMMMLMAEAFISTITHFKSNAFSTELSPAVFKRLVVHSRFLIYRHKNICVLAVSSAESSLICFRFPFYFLYYTFCHG